MHRRLFASVLVVLALAGGYHVSTAAQPPFLSCQLPDGGEVQLVVVANFGGMNDAVQHCMRFWNGLPRGAEK